MYKEIIKPKSEFYNIHIPKEYINKKIEVLIRPIEEDILEKSFNLFKNKKIDPIKWQEEIRIDRL